jgi:hypothetical protein
METARTSSAEPGRLGLNGPSALGMTIEGSRTLAKNPDYAPLKSAGNLFGINEPKQRTFIPIGGPQAHVNSKPRSGSKRVVA